jgi:hypothetical protein
MMDPLQFLNVQFILFSLGIAIITFAVRTTVEYIALERHKEIAIIWSQLILPILPIIIGGTISYFVKDFAVPDGLTSAIGRVFVGIVAGGLSSIVYQIIKGLLTAKIPAIVNSQNASYETATDQSRGRPGSKSA